MVGSLAGNFPSYPTRDHFAANVKHITPPSRFLLTDNGPRDFDPSASRLRTLLSNPAAGTTAAPRRAAYPCPRSMITILERGSTDALRLPDDRLVLAARQRPSSRNARLVETWPGLHTDMCSARGGPAAIFHVDATLRVHARRLGLRDAVSHASRHRRGVGNKHLRVCYSASLEQPRHGAATTPPTECCGVSQQGQRPAGHCALVASDGRDQLEWVHVTTSRLV